MTSFGGQGCSGVVVGFGGKLLGLSLQGLHVCMTAAVVPAPMRKLCPEWLLSMQKLGRRGRRVALRQVEGQLHACLCDGRLGLSRWLVLPKEMGGGMAVWTVGYM